MLRFVVGLGMVGLLVSGCASTGKSVGSSAPPSVGTTANALTTPVVHAPSSPAAVETPTPTPSGGDGSFVMPNEVGKVLQTAQDDLQRVSHDPVFFSHSKDATGQGRFQVLDRDWKVCSQNVPSGRKVAFDAHIVFNVVKLDESCP